jgi:hypothetical protein
MTSEARQEKALLEKSAGEVLELEPYQAGYNHTDQKTERHKRRASNGLYLAVSIRVDKLMPERYTDFITVMKARKRKGHVARKVNLTLFWQSVCLAVHTVIQGMYIHISSMWTLTLSTTDKYQ